IPDEDLSQDAKAQELAKGHIKLEMIAFGKEREAELRRGEGWALSNSDRLVGKIFGAEVGGAKDPATASPGTSSAYGWAQATKGTWMRWIKAEHPELYARRNSDEEIYSLREDEEMSKRFATWYIGVITGQLSRNGLPVNDGTVYLGYFLGEGSPQTNKGGVLDMLRAPADALAATINPSAAAANKAVFYHKDGRPKTVAEVRQWAARKMDQP